VAKFIGKPLDVVRADVGIVIDDNVVSWSYSSLAHILGNEEEIIEVFLVDSVVNHCARRRIFQIVALKEILN
jgi:hypothetical protein